MSENGKSYKFGIQIVCIRLGGNTKTCFNLNAQHTAHTRTHFKWVMVTCPCPAISISVLYIYNIHDIHTGERISNSVHMKRKDVKGMCEATRRIEKKRVLKTHTYTHIYKWYVCPIQRIV